MSLPHDLLEQAQHLAGRERGKPRQASLRRAVSVAYYSLFHLLLGEAAQQAIPGAIRTLRPLSSRAINHGDLKKVALWFAPGGNLPAPLAGSIFISPDMHLFADACLRLQQLRHEADYDVTVRLTRSQAQQHVRRAQQAFAAWGRIRATDEAKAFLALLLVTDRWKR